MEKNLKICFTCKKELEMSCFAKCKKNKKDGLGSNCKNCISLKYRGKPHLKFNNPELDPYYNVPIGHKRCTQCKTIHPLDFYFKGQTKKDGLLCECKDCSSKRKHGKSYSGKRGTRALVKSLEYSDGTKLCLKCKEIKPLDDFRNNYKSEFKRSWCRFCELVNRAAKVYNITEEEYIKLIKQQDNKCYICNKPESSPNRFMSLDHNHITGEVRKLLCHNCNVGLGVFQDSPELLLKAAEYLKLHQEPILTNKIEELIPLN